VEIVEVSGSVARSQALERERNLPGRYPSG